METWFIIIFSLCISALVKSILCIIQSSSKTKKLPPGPTALPILGSIIWLRKSFFQLEPIIHNLMLNYGPMITLKIGSKPVIFIADHSLAHNALFQAGAIFSDRPQQLSTGHISNSHHCNITSAAYGPNWRLLRRNMAETIHSVRLKTFSSGRKWVLRILLQNLLSDQSGLDSIKVVDHIQYAMFSLLVLMCFGEKFEEEKIREIEKVHRNVLLSVFKFNVLNVWPRMGSIIFWKQRKQIIGFRKDQISLLIPIIKTRLEKVKKQRVLEDDVVAYVDGLADLKLPEEGNRKLSEEEMVSLCGEFLNAATDTTSISLQWIMANLVKYPQVQENIYKEIISVVGSEEELAEKVAKDEDLQRMPYLKAVVLESLRLHPPAHFVVPHSVSEGVELDGYLIPKHAVVIFMAAEMGRDGEVWKDPMEFRPERFLHGNREEGFDITCSREIKMMPFGAGRRMCPGYTLALLHLEYFVANLVWSFEWKPAVGNYDVDLSENQGFTVGMKNPLLVCISPRAKPFNYNK